jgi:tubulin polyglutamylase complex subunit 2
MVWRFQSHGCQLLNKRLYRTVVRFHNNVITDPLSSLLPFPKTGISLLLLQRLCEQLVKVGTLTGPTSNPRDSGLLLMEASEETAKPAAYVLFDEIAFNILSYLESIDEVCDIDFIANPAAKHVEINLWERRNAPSEFPSDFKRFLNLYNGIHLKWKVQVVDQPIVIGEIKINKMDQILPLAIDGAQFLPADASGLSITLPDPKTSTAYAFSSCDDGIVVLLYRHQSTLFPEVWCVDNNKRWHFICYSFTQYLRLAVLHLGIIGWHAMYFPEGMTMSTRQWMGMFCRERLCVYENQRLAAKK